MKSVCLWFLKVRFVPYEDREAVGPYKSPSPVPDVTKMNCYIVLTNEGSPSWSPLSSPQVWLILFFVFFYPFPSLLFLFFMQWVLVRLGPTECRGGPRSKPAARCRCLAGPSLVLCIWSLSVVLQRREARVLPVPIVSCMINGQRARFSRTRARASGSKTRPGAETRRESSPPSVTLALW